MHMRFKGGNLAEKVSDLSIFHERIPVGIRRLFFVWNQLSKVQSAAPTCLSQAFEGFGLAHGSHFDFMERIPDPQQNPPFQVESYVGKDGGMWCTCGSRWGYASSIDDLRQGHIIFLVWTFAKIKSSVLSGTWFFLGARKQLPLEVLAWDRHLNFAPMASGNHASFLDVILAVVAMPNYVLRRCPGAPRV